MNCLLISYDLGVPETSKDYQNVIKYLKSLGTWAKPLYSVFLVLTNKTVSEVRNQIKDLTDENDKILVLDVKNDSWATARISTDVTSWMNKNI